MDWTNCETCVLFGDASGAMVLGATQDEDRGLLACNLRTDGSMTGVLGIYEDDLGPLASEGETAGPALIRMRGREVYKAAVRLLPETVQAALDKAGLTTNEITHVIAHQANLRIIELALETLGVPLEKCWVNIERYGNTSSASMPITLDEANRAGRLKPGDVVAMMAIGAGLTWGSAIVRW